MRRVGDRRTGLVPGRRRVDATWKADVDGRRRHQIRRVVELAGRPTCRVTADAERGDGIRNDDELLGSRRDRIHGDPEPRSRGRGLAASATSQHVAPWRTPSGVRRTRASVLVLPGRTSVRAGERSATHGPRAPRSSVASATDDHLAMVRGAPVGPVRRFGVGLRPCARSWGLAFGSGHGDREERRARGFGLGWAETAFGLRPPREGASCTAPTSGCAVRVDSAEGPTRREAGCVLRAPHRAKAWWGGRSGTSSLRATGRRVRGDPAPVRRAGAVQPPSWPSGWDGGAVSTAEAVAIGCAGGWWVEFVRLAGVAPPDLEDGPSRLDG